MTGFILGAIVGAAAMWVYGDRLRAYLDDKTHNVRTKAASTLQSAAEGLQAAKETLEAGLGGERERRGR